VVYSVDIKKGWKERRQDQESHVLQQQNESGQPSPKVSKKYERREILKGVSGQANPGETLFIMGASGSGKTSLLNVISDRISRHRHTNISGQVTINEKTKLDIKTFSKIGAYVM
jgi:ABC-type multidrug transport system ATPase subunit